MGDTISRQTADLLEAADRLGRQRAIAPVDNARVKPQPGQLALQRLDPFEPFRGWFRLIDS